MKQRYFQFPLCALSFVLNCRPEVRRAFNYIISYGCIEVGRKQWLKFNPYEKELRRSGSPNASVCRGPIDVTNDDQLQVVAGAEHLHIIVHTLIAQHDVLAGFIKDFEASHGTDAPVRICKDWVFEVRDNKGMAVQEFVRVRYTGGHLLQDRTETLSSANNTGGRLEASTWI